MYNTCSALFYHGQKQFTASRIPLLLFIYLRNRGKTCRVMYRHLETIALHGIDRYRTADQMELQALPGQRKHMSKVYTSTYRERRSIIDLLPGVPRPRPLKYIQVDDRGLVWLL